jgi:class 3 adenylate cyclase
MMVDLPNGTVTLLFTDVEGSTRLLRRLGERYGAALEDQRRILEATVTGHGGTVIDSRGDELFAAFPRARAAVAAAVSAQRALAEHAWPDGDTLTVRMGLHTGEPALQDEGYLGLDVHRAARISAAAHGEQVLLSQTTRDLLGEEGGELLDLGEHELKDFSRPARLFQVVIPGLTRDFPPLRAAVADLPAGRERELAAALTGPKRFLERLRPSKRGFADLGWDVRALLPSAPREAQDSLSRLARELFDAARAAAEADQALAVVNRKKLVERLADQRAQAVLSKASAREADATESRLRTLDALAGRRAEAEAVAKDVRDWLSARQPVETLDGLTEPVRQATQTLNAALDSARLELASVNERLRRTRSPGVFRTGEAFVVPYVDEVGVDRRRRFDSLADAISFRRGLRISRRAEAMFGADDSVGRETTHLSGYVGKWEVGEHQAQHRR